MSETSHASELPNNTSQLSAENVPGLELESFTNRQIQVILLRHAAHRNGEITEEGKQQIRLAAEKIFDHYAQTEDPVNFQIGFSPVISTATGKMRAEETGKTLAEELQHDNRFVDKGNLKRPSIREGLPPSDFTEHLEARVTDFPEFDGDAWNLWRESIKNPELLGEDGKRMMQEERYPSPQSVAQRIDKIVQGLLAVEQRNPTWMTKEEQYVFVLVSHDDALGPWLLNQGYKFGPADLVKNCEPIFCTFDNGQLHSEYNGTEKTT